MNRKLTSDECIKMKIDDKMFKKEKKKKLSMNYKPNMMLKAWLSHPNSNADTTTVEPSIGRLKSKRGAQMSGNGEDLPPKD